MLKPNCHDLITYWMRKHWVCRVVHPGRDYWCKSNSFWQILATFQPSIRDATLAGNLPERYRSRTRT